MIEPREVVLVENFLPDRQESMLRFGQLIADGMRARGWCVDIWRPTPRFANLAGKYRYGGIPKYLGYLDKFLVFPRTISRRLGRGRSGRPFHIVDHSNAVYVSALKSEHVLVTCHDLLQVRSALGEFPQHAVSGTGRKYQQWILQNLRKAPRVICISGKTRKDLQRLTNLTDAQTPVIYMGLNYPYRPMERPEAEQLFRACFARHGRPQNEFAALPHGFLFGIGGAHWYKNRTGLVSMFAALQKHRGTPNRLVYVGPAFDPEQEAILRAARLEDAVIRLTGVSNEELRAAYSLTRGLLFPSWEEGFGWPIAEAQACGCPVFTSNREPMTEIGGVGACYIDPADSEGAAQNIAEKLARPGSMVADGLRQATHWNTDRMLDEYEQAYRGSLIATSPLAAAVR